jgi:hypothetical protein
MTPASGVQSGPYGELLSEVKGRIQAAQRISVQAVNAELLRLYWDIWRLIAARQAREGWARASYRDWRAICITNGLG